VKFRVEKSFDRDVDRIKNKRLLKNLRKLISSIKDADSVHEIPHTKKMEGYESYYRVRLGDYRLGMEVLPNGEAVLFRFLHRKEIYRFFPKR